MKASSNEEQTDREWSPRERFEAVLRGEQPDRWPFVDRLEIWHATHSQAGTLPSEFAGMSLTELHSAVGLGRQLFVAPYGLRLRGVEVIVEFNGTEVSRQYEPVVDGFPLMDDYVPMDRAGRTSINLVTRHGSLRVEQEMPEIALQQGASPYPRRHLIAEEADFRLAEEIVEAAEFVPHFDCVYDERQRLGEIGVVVPRIHRLPFQQMLLEYVGEEALFYALYDTPDVVNRLLSVLDEQMWLIIERLADLDVPYVEFPDNLHGLMTNPRLFERFCLEPLQAYNEALHRQGKATGSHTDGDMRPLLALLAQSGLDVCESFSPAPLTACTFEEAWRAWSDGPTVWGGIPSPLLDTRTPQAEFETFVDGILTQVADSGRPIIFGVGDQVMGDSAIERVRYVADRLATQPTQ